MKNASVFLLVIALSGCPSSQPKPDPTPTPTPAGNVYEAACANLGTFNCSEGLADNCVETMQKTQEKGLVDLKPSCLANAKSVGEVQACGSVECTQDLGLAATCATACSNLKKLGCKEGVDTSCTVICQKEVTKKLVKVNLTCLAKAKTKAGARSCGGIDCP